MCRRNHKRDRPIEMWAVFKTILRAKFLPTSITKSFVAVNLTYLHPMHLEAPSSPAGKSTINPDLITQMRNGKL